MSLLLPHFWLDSPQERPPCEAARGSEPPLTSSGWGQDEAVLGKVQGTGELLALAHEAGAARWRHVPQLPGTPPPGRLGASAGFYRIHGPISSVSGAQRGFVVWNTFLIKRGNEQGAPVVHAAPKHGAGTGLPLPAPAPGVATWPGMQRV